MIHNATLLTHGTVGDGIEETFLFSSLDGKYWLPVNRHGVTGQDEEALEKIFEGDGNFKPMRWTRRYLEDQGAVFHEQGLSQAALETLAIVAKEES